MEGETETTRSTMSYESRHDSQSMLDYYVKEMLDCVREDPWVSTPGIWEHITSAGPCVRPSGVMHLFGGEGQFRRTCQRMTIVRWAVAEGREEELPLGQEIPTFAEICRRVDENQRDDNTLWWAPDIWSCEPYDEERRPFPHEGVLYYRPSQDDSDDFFEQESGDEAPSQSSDDAMEVDA